MGENPGWKCHPDHLLSTRLPVGLGAITGWSVLTKFGWIWPKQNNPDKERTVFHTCALFVCRNAEVLFTKEVCCTAGNDGYRSCRKAPERWFSLSVPETYSSEPDRSAGGNCGCGCLLRQWWIRLYHRANPQRIWRLWAGNAFVWRIVWKRNEALVNA